jgi:hypothetical protein
MEVRRGGHCHRGSCIAHRRQHVVEGQNAGRLGSGARSIISAVTPDRLMMLKQHGREMTILPPFSLPDPAFVRMVGATLVYAMNKPKRNDP